ncbi:MAG: hypothetical protein V4510_01660 [bacterium]
MILPALVVVLGLVVLVVRPGAAALQLMAMDLVVAGLFVFLMWWKGSARIQLDASGILRSQWLRRDQLIPWTSVARIEPILMRGIYLNLTFHGQNPPVSLNVPFFRCSLADRQRLLQACEEKGLAERFDEWNIRF